MKGIRMDWPALVLAGILVVLGAIAVWGWARRREAVDADARPSRTAEPIAIPVVAEEGPATQVAEEGTPTPARTTASSPDPAAASPRSPARAAADPAPAVGAAAGATAAVEVAPTPGPPDPHRIVRGADPARPFGPASAAPAADGSGPDGWSVKGNADSGLYHTPASPSWKRMKAEAWFESEGAAEAAGFTRWDWRRAGP